VGALVDGVCDGAPPKSVLGFSGAEVAVCVVDAVVEGNWNGLDWSGPAEVASG
jgi:hypothetical protein